MDWSLCIATLNRRDALLRTLRHALAQTVPPREVVVVDSGDDWQQTEMIARAQIFHDHPQVSLIYRHSEVRSSAVQRNLAVGLSRCEIIFMLDDDSFLFPDCAETILRIYATDTGGRVACISAAQVAEIPALPGAVGDQAPAPVLERKQSGRGGMERRLLSTPLGRWINSKVLLQSMDELFIKYEGERNLAIPEAVAGMGVLPVTFVQGCAITVRRAVALAEPFDPALRYYAAAEDQDASYRYGRHGAVLLAEKARLHHFSVAGGRIGRREVIIFQLLNLLVFIRRNAAAPDRWRGAYRLLLWRRLLGEFLKDGLSRRFDFPQMRGVLCVIVCWSQVWRRDGATLDRWYPEMQKDILDRAAGRSQPNAATQP